MLMSFIRSTLYIKESPSFSPSGTKVPCYSLISGRVAAFRASDSIAINAMTSIGWTCGPPDQRINHVLNYLT